MKLKATIGRNRNWAESAALGVAGGLLCAVLLPVAAVLAGILVGLVALGVLAVPVLGLLGLVRLEEDTEADDDE